VLKLARNRDLRVARRSRLARGRGASVSTEKHDGLETAAATAAEARWHAARMFTGVIPVMAQKR